MVNKKMIKVDADVFERMINALRFYAQEDTHINFDLDIERQRLCGKDPIVEMRFGGQKVAAPRGKALSDIEKDRGLRARHVLRLFTPSDVPLPASWEFRSRSVSANGTYDLERTDDHDFIVDDHHNRF